MCNFNLEKAKEYYEQMKNGAKRHVEEFGYGVSVLELKKIAKDLNIDISFKSGTYKSVIVFNDYDFVLKFGYDSFFEMYIYDNLIEKGYEDICDKLVKNTFLGYIGKTAVFAQEKVIIAADEDEMQNECLLQNYNDVYHMIYEENVGEDEIEEDSLADYLEKSEFINEYIFLYGMDNDCYKWVKEYNDVYGSFQYDFDCLYGLYELDDWHSGNFGYRENGQPVIIDYAGYRNSEELVAIRDEYIINNGCEYKEEV